MLCGEEKRFMVLDSIIMRRKKTQFIYYGDLKKCNSLFCLGGTSLLFCLFVRSTVLWRTLEPRWLSRIARWGGARPVNPLHWPATGPGLPRGRARGGGEGAFPCCEPLAGSSGSGGKWGRPFWRHSSATPPLRVVVGIKWDAVCEAASIYCVHYRDSLNGSHFIVVLYLLNICL